MQSKVTVAICAYNAAAYIEQTLRGVLRQTFKEFELLIINDCSTDNTLEVVESTLLDFRHRVINLTHNQGIAYARERALEESRTRYVIFIDADDIPLSGLLEQEYRVISSDDNIIGVSSWYRFIDTDGRAMRGGLFTGPKSREAFELMARGEKLIFLPIYTMFDREAALRVGGFRLDGFPCGRPRHQDYCEDLDLWTRMSDLYVEGKYMVTIPQILYNYRKGHSGLSSNSVYMTLKMIYVKRNLKLRRAGESEISYVDFMGSVSAKKMNQLEYNARAGYYLRNGVLNIERFRLFSGVCDIVRSMAMNPHYFMQKLRANIRIFRG